MRWAWTPSPGPARRARCCGPSGRGETAARLLDALHDNTLINRNIVLNGLSAEPTPSGTRCSSSMRGAGATRSRPDTERRLRLPRGL